MQTQNTATALSTWTTGNESEQERKPPQKVKSALAC